MKRIILLLCICFLTLKSKSQIVAQDHEGLATFLNSTLYVPITGYKEFDEALQSAFKKYWKITPYKMANEAEYSALEKENKKRKGKQSFLFELSYSSFSITRTSYVSTFYQGTEGYDFYDKTKKFNHAKYRIDYVVKLMNDAITLVKNNKLGPAPGNSTLSSPLRDELCKLFSENAKVIKDKTLILNRDMKFLRTEIYDEKIFAKYYPYSYKFVSEDEFNRHEAPNGRVSCIWGLKRDYCVAWKTIVSKIFYFSVKCRNGLPFLGKGEIWFLWRCAGNYWWCKCFLHRSNRNN